MRASQGAPNSPLLGTKRSRAATTVDSSPVWPCRCSGASILGGNAAATQRLQTAGKLQAFVDRKRASWRAKPRAATSGRKRGRFLGKEGAGGPSPAAGLVWGGPGPETAPPTE